MTDYKDFANFRDYEGEGPGLPVAGLKEEMSYKNLRHGSYVAGFPVGDNFIKLHVFGRFNKQGNLEVSDVNDNLIPRTVDPEEDSKNANSIAIELAAEVKHDYDMFKVYIGDFMPEFKGAVVTEVPRREIEKIKHGMLTPTEEANIPSHQVSVVEIWQRLDPTTSLMSRSHSDIENLYKDDEFKEESSGFANGAIKLLLTKGKILDISDSGGVFVSETTPDRRLTRYIEFNELSDLIQDNKGKKLLIPRNTFYSQKDGLNFIDIYPSEKINDRWMPYHMIFDMMRAIEDKNLDSLQNMVFQEPSRVRHRLVILSHLILLNKMGADFSKFYDLENEI